MKFQEDIVKANVTIKKHEQNLMSWLRVGEGCDTFTSFFFFFFTFIIIKLQIVFVDYNSAIEE